MRAERALRMSGLSYAILRLSALFGLDEILLNNVAWAVRRFPVVLLPGRGDYRIQPVFVGGFRPDVSRRGGRGRCGGSGCG